MRSVAPMRAAKIGGIAVSVLVCALGVFMMFRPETSAYALCIACGVLFILLGVIKLVGYFSKDLYRLAFQFDLAFGIFMFTVGIVMLSRPGEMMNLICVILGLCILADGLFRIQTSLNARHFGLPLWWLILVWAIVTGALGFLLLLRPGIGGRALMILTGAAMTADGLLTIDTIVTSVKIIKNQQRDIIDAEFYE